MYRSGDTHLVTNYRPIVLLTNFSEIFEKIIYTMPIFADYLCRVHITSYMGLFRPLISLVFIGKKSTSMAVLEMLDKLHQATALKHFAIGIFIDLAKAFDTIHHNS